MMLGEHRVPQHFGIRTKRYKLFYIPESDEWQMFDLKEAPNEMKSVYGLRQYRYAGVQTDMLERYHAMRKEVDAPSYEKYAPKRGGK